MAMKWNKYPDVKPKKEGKQYLIATDLMGDKNYRFFSIAGWSNNLYKTNKYDFIRHKGKKKSGFYICDSEYGDYEIDCAYWAEIEPPKERGE